MINITTGVMSDTNKTATGNNVLWLIMNSWY